MDKPPADLAHLRQEYMRAGLDEADADPDPLRLFDRWFRAAVDAALPLPNAMTLATADKGGTPSARIVLLNGYGKEGFVFYSNYESRKGRELDARPAACLVFFWGPLERQVRIDGSVEKLDAAASDAYFNGRPVGARLSAWASQQSEAVPGRGVLEAALAEAGARYGDNPPRPPHWGGYRVLPREIEFWQGRANRLHDRLRYTRQGGSAWTIGRLAP